jgi:Na+-transporting methylmalonyl-CoA/oxaloacetate decarboxylase gamma subunit
MVIPLAMLAILAFVVIRSLMGVVAHEEALTAIVPEPFPAETASPARAHANDDGRGLLLPAAQAAAVDADVAVDLTVADANAS